MKIRHLVGSLVLAMSVVSAQDFMTSIGQKSRALLFTFNGLNTLGAGNFNGGIGGKYFLSPAMAVRGGLQFGTSHTTISANPIAPATGTDGSNTSMQYGLSAAMEYHLLPTRVSPYVGAGVSVSSMTTEAKNAVIGAPPPAQTTVKNAAGGGAGLRLGAGGLLGVEFFLTKEISLSTEYMLGFNMNNPYDQEVINGATTTTTKGNPFWGINVSTVGFLTLSVYF